MVTVNFKLAPSGENILGIIVVEGLITCNKCNSRYQCCLLLLEAVKKSMWNWRFTWHLCGVFFCDLLSWRLIGSLSCSSSSQNGIITYVWLKYHSHVGSDKSRSHVPSDCSVNWLCLNCTEKYHCKEVVIEEQAMIFDASTLEPAGNSFHVGVKSKTWVTPPPQHLQYYRAAVFIFRCNGLLFWNCACVQF